MRNMETSLRSAAVFGTSFAIAAAVWLMGANASAESSKVEAKQHFDAGNALVDNEDYAAATSEFELSVRLFPTKMGLFNLANCYKALTRYGDALEALARLESEFAEKLGTLSRDVSSLKNTIEGMVGRLDVKVDKDSAAIRVDGTEVGTSPLPKPLVFAPGDHVIETRLSGFVDASQTVRIAARETHEVSFVLVEEPAPVPVVAPPVTVPPPAPVQVAPAPPPAGPLDALLVQAETDTAAQQDMVWFKVERIARDKSIPAAQRIAVLRQFLADYPSNDTHVEYANLLIETLTAGGNPKRFLMDPERLRTKNEWFSLRGEGGTYGGGAMISLFTIKWRWVYWEILRLCAGGGIPSSHGSVRWWSLMGTALGVPIHLGVTRRHELRIGIGVMAGPMEEYSYTEGSSMSDSDDSNKYDAFSFGPIVEPEVSYVFHAARRFALQIGVGVYLATMAATVEGKGAHCELPAPIVNGFLGFRL